MNFNFKSSFISEKLETLITEKRNYFPKVKNDYARKKLQSEILFLENEVLPIILKETTLLYYEFSKFFESGLKKSISNKCDAMLLFLPLSNDLGEVCKVGVINPKSQMFGHNPIENIDVGIDSLGVGRRKIIPLNLDL